MNSESDGTCLHAACACPVPAGETHCSEHCRVHAEEARCECGHAHCGAVDRTERA